LIYVNAFQQLSPMDFARLGRQTAKTNKATDAIMASSAHYYLNWAKVGIDKMDAVLTGAIP
jgi:hypothetical protein